MNNNNTLTNIANGINYLNKRTNNTCVGSTDENYFVISIDKTLNNVDIEIMTCLGWEFDIKNNRFYFNL